MVNRFLQYFGAIKTLRFFLNLGIEEEGQSSPLNGSMHEMFLQNRIDTRPPEDAVGGAKLVLLPCMQSVNAFCVA